MTMILAICVAVTFAVSIYLMLGRELKGIAMGVFLLGHAANLSIIAMSGSPVGQEQPVAHAQHENEAGDAEVHLTAVDSPDMKDPPILTSHAVVEQPLAQIVDPLPQALILTAIVIGFGVMAFLLTLLVVTNRKTHTIEVDELAQPPQKEANQA
jgi:multicomponent Na+:H+ antiporter subunit C